MPFVRNTVARKLLMALTGWMMILFVIFHIMGNATIYFSGLNAYAAALHAFPPLIWGIRFVMLAAAVIHIIFGIALTLGNRGARPQQYEVRRELVSTFAGRNMIWTGSVIGAFLVYHLLHFTLQVVDPSTSALRNIDTLGRPDVFLMVVRSFSRTSVVAIYLAGVLALLLHLTHGIQSSFQTWGLNSERTFPYVRKGGTVVAILLFMAYAAIPVVIVAGVLR